MATTALVALVGVSNTQNITSDAFFYGQSPPVYPSRKPTLLPAFIKTIFFGLAIGFVGCYKGFHSSKGTESVGIAANSAVVTASLWIFVIDAIAVQITSLLFYK